MISDTLAFMENNYNLALVAFGVFVVVSLMSARGCLLLLLVSGIVALYEDSQMGIADQKTNQDAHQVLTKLQYQWPYRLNYSCENLWSKVHAGAGEADTYSSIDVLAEILGKLIGIFWAALGECSLPERFLRLSFIFLTFHTISLIRKGYTFQLPLITIYPPKQVEDARVKQLLQLLQNSSEQQIQLNRKIQEQQQQLHLLQMARLQQSQVERNNRQQFHFGNAQQE